LLANGEVLVTGGSTVANALADAAYTTQLWNPSTGLWTTGAAAAKPAAKFGQSGRPAGYDASVGKSAAIIGNAGESAVREQATTTAKATFEWK